MIRICCVPLLVLCGTVSCVGEPQNNPAHETTWYVQTITTKNSYQYGQTYRFHYSPSNQVDSITCQTTNDYTSPQSPYTTSTTRLRYVAHRLMIDDTALCTLDPNNNRVTKVIYKSYHQTQLPSAGQWNDHPMIATQTYTYNPSEQLIRSDITEQCTRCNEVKYRSSELCAWKNNNLTTVTNQTETTQDVVRFAYGPIENNARCNLDLNHMLATIISHSDLPATLGLLGLVGARNRTMACQETVNGKTNQYRYVLDSDGFIIAAKRIAPDSSWVEYQIAYNN